MNKVLIISLILLLILGGFFYFKILLFLKKEIFVPTQTQPEEQTKNSKEQTNQQPTPGIITQKINQFILRTEEFIEESENVLEIKGAKQRSQNVKGLYMNEFVANSKSLAGTKIRQDINSLLYETQLNAIVIDVKEAHGPYLPYSLKPLIKELKERDIWIIARIVVFRDSSLIDEKPDLYLKTKDGDFWQDQSGEYWLDPASPEVEKYITEFSKKVIDFGFDELQFDYIRFPSDGDLENIVYPFYDKKKEKWEVIREFMQNISRQLRKYQTKIILSADLFGLVAVHHNELGIGQRLEDAAEFFDYISPMLYPSHFYGGFKVKKDESRKLPALYFPYESEDISQVVSNHPYEVVFRSIFSARDYFSELDFKTEIRPWLQDFSLKKDSERGIHYDVEKIQLQIEAAEAAGASGWLLWSPANIYTEDAL